MREEREEKERQAMEKLVINKSNQKVGAAIILLGSQENSQ
jgi:hypothetical protein